MTISVKKVKKGDTVVILQGRDAGRRGKVLRVLPREQKVIVENLNIKSIPARALRIHRVALLTNLHLWQAKSWWSAASATSPQGLEWSCRSL